MSHRMWAVYNSAGYPVAVRHSRSECIAEAEAFWARSWRSIKRRYGAYIARVIVELEEHDAGGEA